MLMTSGSASGFIQCNAGEITLVTSPSVTESDPNINSTGGTWSSCGLSFTGYYKEWLGDGVVISGTEVWVPGGFASSPPSFSYTVTQDDMGHAITSGVQPCNADGCYGSYAISSNSVTPTYPDDYVATDDWGTDGLTGVSPTEAGTATMATSSPMEGGADPEDSEGTASADCWHRKAWANRGRVGYGRKVIQENYWCASPITHNITYRRTHTTTSPEFLCSTNYKEQWRIDGGVGSSWVSVHSGAEFSCVVGPWITISSKCNIDVKYTYADTTILYHHCTW